MTTVETWADVLALAPAFSARLGAALLCGVLLGFERERKDKPAGIRTIVLITVGSALFMFISNLVPFAYEWTELARIDPGRIAAQVISGIGFIGAGTIIQARGSVHGLTTAAVIWVAAGIGMCAGLGYVILAFLFTVVVLVALVVMDPLRAWASRLGDRYDLFIIAPDDSLVLERIRQILRSHDIVAEDIDVSRAGTDELRVDFLFRGHRSGAIRLLEQLSELSGVHGARTGEIPRP